MASAKNVKSNDIDEIALQVANLNFKMNKVGGIEMSSENILANRSLWDEVKRDFDILIMGDMFYDQEIGEIVLEFVHHFISSEVSKTVLIGGFFLINAKNEM